MKKGLHSDTLQLEGSRQLAGRPSRMTTFSVERGSKSERATWSDEVVAPADHRDEPLPVRRAVCLAVRHGSHGPASVCHRAPLPRASAFEEQIVCGLLERCGELPVGEAGLAEFAEGLVAGEHEEEVECAGGCAVA